MLLTHESSRAKTALLDTDYTKDLSTAVLCHHGEFYYVVRISTHTSLAARAFSQASRTRYRGQKRPTLRRRNLKTEVSSCCFFYFKVRSCLISSNANVTALIKRKNKFITVTRAVLFSKSLFRKTYFRKASSVFPGISCRSLTSQGEYRYFLALVISLTSSRGMSFAPHLFTHSKGIRLQTFICSCFEDRKNKHLSRFICTKDFHS